MALPEVLKRVLDSADLKRVEEMRNAETSTPPLPLTPRLQKVASYSEKQKGRVQTVRAMALNLSATSTKSATTVSGRSLSADHSGDATHSDDSDD